MNAFKTMALMVALTLLLVWAGAAIGGRSGMTIALAFAFIMNIITYWFSDKIVLRMYGAKEVNEAEAPELFNTVRSLAQKASVPLPRVYIVENDSPNAFATGRNPSHAAVAVTTGILRLLSRDELSGVIAHELAHVKHRDILIQTVAATIAGAISYLAQMAQWAMIFGGRSSDDDDRGHPIAALAMMIVGPIAAFLIQMAVSRSREYSADEGGARIAGSPFFLANALRKLHTASQVVPLNANPVTAHMFTISPLTGRGILALFSTHPPVEERIARLEAMTRG